MKFQPGQIFRNTQRHVDVDRFSTDRPIRQFIKEEILQVEEVIEEPIAKRGRKPKQL
jgi:hypothetical protein